MFYYNDEESWGLAPWDREANSGYKTKQKLSLAHDLTNSPMESLTILYLPVHVFSIDGAETHGIA